MLLSLIVVSGVLSELSLRGLRVARRLPHRAQVERPHVVEIEVHNDKRRAPSYAIEVEDLRAGQPADKRCFFLKVSPSSSQVAAYRRVPARRGLDRHVGFRVATRFPFGFFEKSREFDAEEDLIIYPAVDAVRLPGPLEGTRAEGSRAGRRGSGEEILGLRAMREGDDPRHIYWKRSASGGSLAVVERAREVRARVQLRLANLFEGEPPSAEDRKRFERAVRDVASRAVAHLRRGEEVRLETTSGAAVAGSPASGADQILRFLALIELERRGDGTTPHVHLAEPSPEPAEPAIDPTLGLGPSELEPPSSGPRRAAPGPGGAGPGGEAS